MSMSAHTSAHASAHPSVHASVHESAHEGGLSLCQSTTKSAHASACTKGIVGGGQMCNN